MTTEKIVTAAFGRYDTVTVYGLYQYDYGAKLRIEGLSLPKAVEIHYSTHETGGTSEPRIGITEDGVTVAPIPDSLLEINSTRDYCIYAFLYIADQTSGQTIKKITMPVTARPRPEIWDTPEDADLFREAIAAVNSSAERAEKAAESIGGYVDEAKADIDEYVAGKESELRGEPGEPGEPGQPGTTPHIGDNGHWYIGDTDTGVDARGMDGITPHIGDNGHWWIGDVDTGVVAGGGGGGAVEDVQIDGVSIVDGGVAEIPTANDTQCGVVKVPTSPTMTNSGGIYVKNNVPTINTNMKYGVYYSDGYGALRIVDADTTDINNKRNVADNYSVIVPHNLDYAVKAAMTDGIGVAWTADEQAAARDRMGIGDYEIILSTKLTEESIPEFDLGNDYKSLFIEIAIPSTNTLSGSCTIMNQNNEQISYFPSGSLLVGNSAKFGISEIKLIANKIYSFTNVGTNNTAMNNKSNSSLFPVSTGMISKVKFRNSLPADAEITIYGAR